MQHPDRYPQQDPHRAIDARDIHPLVGLVKIRAVRAKLDCRDAELGGEKVGIAKPPVASMPAIL